MREMKMMLTLVVVCSFLFSCTPKYFDIPTMNEVEENILKYEKIMLK